MTVYSLIIYVSPIKKFRMGFLKKLSVFLFCKSLDILLYRLYN